MRIARLIASGAAVLALAAACDSPARETTGSLESLRVKSYREFSDLRADSVAVVRIEAGETIAVRDIGGIPFTITRATVLDVLDGSLTATEIALRQEGSRDVELRESLPIVEEGREYVAFLYRERFEGESPDIQYWPTGGTGLFLESSDGVEHLDPLGSLPSVDDVNDLLVLAREAPPLDRVPYPQAPA